MSSKLELSKTLSRFSEMDQDFRAFINLVIVGSNRYYLQEERRLRERMKEHALLLIQYFGQSAELVVASTQSEKLTSLEEEYLQSRVQILARAFGLLPKEKELQVFAEHFTDKDRKKLLVLDEEYVVSILFQLTLRYLHSVRRISYKYLTHSEEKFVHGDHGITLTNWELNFTVEHIYNQMYMLQKIAKSLHRQPSQSVESFYALGLAHFIAVIAKLGQSVEKKQSQENTSQSHN